MNSRSLGPFLFAACLMLAPLASLAADVTWDASPDNGTLEDGSGTWKNQDPSLNNWTVDGGATNQQWNNANADVAVFGAAGGTGTVSIDPGGVTAGGLVFQTKYTFGDSAGTGTVTLQGQGDEGNKVAELVFNERATVYGNVINSATTDKVIVRRDDKGGGESYTGYVNWYGPNHFSCVLQIGDDAGTPELAKQPLIYSSATINDDCPEVRVMPNNRLYLRTGHVFGAPLTLMGAGYGGQGQSALYLFSSGSGWGGEITLAGDVVVTSRGTDTGTTYLNGNIVETAGGPKSLTLNNVSYGPTLEMAGTNTYTGDTVIADNTDDTAHPFRVLLKESGSIATSRSVQVGDNTILDVSEHDGWSLGDTAAQTLQGNGTVVGSVTVAAGSSVAPGNSIGTLTVDGDLTVSGSLDIEYDSSTDGIDVLNVTGALDLSGATIAFSDIAETPVPLTQESYVFATYDSLVGSHPSVTGVPTGYYVNYAYEGNQIALAVPEPGAISALLGLLVGMSILFQRRKK